jgi:hypothetical protein
MVEDSAKTILSCSMTGSNLPPIAPLSREAKPALGSSAAGRARLRAVGGTVFRMFLEFATRHLTCLLSREPLNGTFPPAATSTRVDRAGGTGIWRGARMSLSLPLRAGFNDTLGMAWKDGERLVYRGLRQGTEGEQTAVLAVVPAAEPPTSDALDRLTHEYDLKPELDSAWAVRPLELIRERGSAILVLEDPGGQPLELLLESPMAVGQFLPLAIAIAIAEALAKLPSGGQSLAALLPVSPKPI